MLDIFIKSIQDFLDLSVNSSIAVLTLGVAAQSLETWCTVQSAWKIPILCNKSDIFNVLHGIRLAFDQQIAIWPYQTKLWFVCPKPWTPLATYSELSAVPDALLEETSRCPLEIFNRKLLWSKAFQHSDRSRVHRDFSSLLRIYHLVSDWKCSTAISAKSSKYLQRCPSKSGIS